MNDEYVLGAAKYKCTAEHLFFCRYFFKQRFGTKFRVNWHHKLVAHEIDKVIQGKTKNLVINIAPGSSKTEIVVINFLARGLALNPNARFLHLSYSDDLALLNSQTAREIVRSDEFQALWPIKIATDTKSKKRWNVMVNDKMAGGVYATSLDGQVTGFRAGHMTEGFQGAIVIDDPLKPEDGFSKTKLEAANRKLLTTVKSRKANPDTPIVVVMQRISEMDPTGFIEGGALGKDWRIVKIPALLDEKTAKEIAGDLFDEIDRDETDDLGRFSYWQYKEPIMDLKSMEGGEGKDQAGNQISRFVFTSQWQQSPVAIGGNIFKGAQFIRYNKLPPLKYRMIYADTAQKTAERNDRSVFECWGVGIDGRIYLLDLLKGKWEAPDLLKVARAFWAKHKGMEYENAQLGQLRKMKVEDKSSGTGLIQTLKVGDVNQKQSPIPVEGIERNKDKYTRAMDGLPYIESGMVCVPEEAEFTNDFIAECEAFTADDSHRYDDQIDPCLDAIDDLLSNNNKIKTWENLADGRN
jgi:predicted phage terminase large subunit-like protein